MGATQGEASTPFETTEMQASGGAQRHVANIDKKGCLEGDRAASGHTVL